VEFEQGIVYCKFIALEPFEKVTDDGKSVDDGWSHVDAMLIVSLMLECLGHPQHSAQAGLALSLAWYLLYSTIPTSS